MGAAAQAAPAPVKAAAPARDPPGKASAHQKKPAPVNPLWQSLSLSGGGRSGLSAGGGAADPNASPIRVQRKCKACEEEETQDSVQPALTIGPVDDPLEREADAVADRVMRKARGADAAPVSIARGRGSVAPIRRVCKKCGEEEPVQRKPAGAYLQRRCSKCDAELPPGSVRRSASADAGSAGHVASLIAAPGVGAPVPHGVRDPAEAVLDADFSGVRVHSDPRANAAAADINARAFTYGGDIFLGAGESSHDLGLMAHELTHTVQQGASPSRAGGSVQRRPAAVQRLGLPSLDDVTGALDDIGSAVSDAADAVVETGEEIAAGAAEVASEAIDTIEGIAVEVWDAARSLASALGGMVSLQGGRLTITVPEFTACPTIPLQFSLPSVGVSIPIVAGELPVHPLVILYGELYASVGLAPEISMQLGPCRVHGMRIVIDPLGDHYSAAGWVTVTTAAGIGAELTAGLGGEIGAVVIIPMEPPIPVPISLLSLEGGIALQARAIEAATTDMMFSADYTGGVFNGALHESNDIGLAFDWGVGAFAELDVLGFNLCRAYWPMYEGHWDTALHYNLDAAVSIDSSGFAGALSVGGFDPIPFDSMPVELNRDVLSDDCALLEYLCPIIEALGWMPSQNGGVWKGPGDPWGGPLGEVYPRSPPGLESGAMCRGACGPDCDTCSDPVDKPVCVPYTLPDGEEGHDWLVYPNYQVCDTHEGCRQHDGCYDWCAEGGGPGGIGPFLCRRLCDFECACVHRPLVCAGWIFGAEPHDGQLTFSDEPYVEDGCEIPCPEGSEGGGGEGAGDGGDTGTGGGGGGGSGFTVCMPTLELFRQISDGDSWDFGPEEFPIWEDIIIVPYVGPVLLELSAGAGATARADASLGPGTMENVCFDIDALNHVYVARGEIVIPAHLSGQLTLNASLTGSASWFGLIEVVSATGSLSATGTADIVAQLNPTFSATVDVGCGDGEPGSLLKPTIETDLNFGACLDLGFTLDAGFSIEALTFHVWDHQWELYRAQWRNCWGEDLNIDSESGREPDLDLRSIRISLEDIFDWLMSDDAEDDDQDQTPGAGRSVVEDPLTNVKARTIPTLVPDLDDTTYNSQTLSLLPTPSGTTPSATAGRSMMTRFLTHQKTGGGAPSGQDAIYRFNRLPTKGAFNNSGYSADQVYIKGHLLNHSAGSRTLHGIGQPQNLFPITQQANSDHNNDVEEDVKDRVVDDRLVVMYGVNVVHQAPQYVDVNPDGSCRYQYIDADFQCTYATYKLYDDNTVELNTPVTETIESRFDRDGFVAGVSAKHCPEGP